MLGWLLLSIAVSKIEQLRRNTGIFQSTLQSSLKKLKDFILLNFKFNLLFQEIVKQGSSTDFIVEALPGLNNPYLY